MLFAPVMFRVRYAASGKGDSESGDWFAPGSVIEALLSVMIAVPCTSMRRPVDAPVMVMFAPSFTVRMPVESFHVVNGPVPTQTPVPMLNVPVDAAADIPGIIKNSSAVKNHRNFCILCIF